MSRNAHGAPQLSIVVPLFNEVDTIHELHTRLTEVLLLIGLSSEIVYVDDGSSDGTAEALAAIAERDPRVRFMPLARNYGQTAALAAGFDAAAGEVIVAMDGDLQHAPEEIPKLLEKLNEGYDIVSGWREQRVDNLWTRSSSASGFMAICTGSFRRWRAGTARASPKCRSRTFRARKISRTTACRGSGGWPRISSRSVSCCAT
jgi:glycosyltransferase involved in cell wall biosynthesis